MWHWKLIKLNINILGKRNLEKSLKSEKCKYNIFKEQNNLSR